MGVLAAGGLMGTLTRAARLTSKFRIYLSALANDKRGIVDGPVRLEMQLTVEEFDRIYANRDVQMGVGKFAISKEHHQVPLCTQCGGYHRGGAY